MQLPTYHKKIEVVLKDRDFYGFVEEEGEVYIEGQQLISKLRFNDRMTGEKGDYQTTTYQILDYFSDTHLLKVALRPHVAAIFNMNNGELFFGSEYMRLVKDGYDFEDISIVEQGLFFIAHHLCYLYQIAPDAATEMIPAILQLAENSNLVIGDMEIYKEYGSYYIQKRHHPFLLQVIAHRNGIVFSYTYISYYFAGLKKYMEENLKDSDWKIV